jgi:hypothetical protein
MIFTNVTAFYQLYSHEIGILQLTTVKTIKIFAVTAINVSIL